MMLENAEEARRRREAGHAQQLPESASVFFPGISFVPTVSRSRTTRPTQVIGARIERR